MTARAINLAVIMIVVIIFTFLGLCQAYTHTNQPLIKTVWRGGEHSEGPHWSTTENVLYWVDITGQKVHRLDPDTDNVTTHNIEYGPVTPVVTVANAPGLLLICVRSEMYFLPWKAADHDTSMRLVSVVDLGLPDNRCNDGKVDAKGRFWIGTMGKEENGEVDPDQGTLYLVTEQNYLNPPTKLRPVSVSNGLAWTKNNKFMFYIDSPTRNVDVFDFDLESGSITNRRVIFSFAANNVTGVPDGMTIDSDDNLWVACFNGGKVIKIDPRAGKLLEQHKIPADKVTSVMWGGRELTVLYVTTSRLGLSPAQLAKQPDAGSLFSIEGTGCKGMPPNEFVFNNAANY